MLDTFGTLFNWDSFVFIFKITFSFMLGSRMGDDKMILWLINKIDNFLDSTLAWVLAYASWPILWVIEKFNKK